MLFMLGHIASCALFYPAPANYSPPQQRRLRPLNPRTIHFTSTCDNADSPHIGLLFKLYQGLLNSSGGVPVEMSLQHCEMVAADGNEQYSLVVDDGRAEITAEWYPGVVRGLQTFFQAFQERDGVAGVLVPTVIKDAPDFAHRGVMIDTARHFMPISALKQVVDGCMANKLNILHWHITDDDSFPLLLDGVDRSGCLENQCYSKAEVRELVSYAQLRAVRIIPELDTPSHTFSWQRALNDSQSFMHCNSIFGQMDPTQDTTYQHLQTLFTQILELFPDRTIHLGGDQVQQACWDQRPAIQQFMATHGLKTYNDLEVYYRRRQRQLLRGIDGSRRFVYWSNTLKELDWYEKDDFGHWWDGGGDNGNGSNKRALQSVILSYYDKSYLDAGYTGGRGIQTWRSIYYNNKLSFPWSGAKVVGAETAMWSEQNNPQSNSNRVWMRTAALAERTWNKLAPDFVKNDVRGLVSRLQAQRRRMQARGIKTAPLTVQLCQLQPDICF